MGLEHIAPLIDRDQFIAVRRATWGHLAPKKNRTYRGTILFVCGVYDSGDLNPTIIYDKFNGLSDSPWYYQAVSDFLSDWTGDDARRHDITGKVFRWDGTFRNYEFKGTFRPVWSAETEIART